MIKKNQFLFDLKKSFRGSIMKKKLKTNYFRIKTNLFEIKTLYYRERKKKKVYTTTSKKNKL